MPKMSGPPPKPTQWRVIEGDRSRRPANLQEPKLAAGEPPFPYFLAELDAERIARQLEARTVEQLRQHAKALGVPRYSRLRREELVERLLEVEPGPRKRAWAWLLEQLEPMQVVTPADGASLALAVDALVEWQDIMRLLEREGRYWQTTGRFGLQRKRHPAIEQLNKTRNFFQSMVDRFGGNPAYRAKVQIAASAAAGGSAWDALDEMGADA